MKRRHRNFQKNRRLDHNLYIGEIFATTGWISSNTTHIEELFVFFTTPFYILKDKLKVFFIPKTSSEDFKTFIYLFSDLSDVHELIGTKIRRWWGWGQNFWKLWRGCVGFWNTFFRMNQEVRCKKPFENWFTVNGSKLDL